MWKHLFKGKQFIYEWLFFLSQLDEANARWPAQHLKLKHSDETVGATVKGALMWK